MNNKLNLFAFCAITVAAASPFESVYAISQEKTKERPSIQPSADDYPRPKALSDEHKKFYLEMLDKVKKDPQGMTDEQLIKRFVTDEKTKQVVEFYIRKRAYEQFVADSMKANTPVFPHDTIEYMADDDFKAKVVTYCADKYIKGAPFIHTPFRSRWKYVTSAESAWAWAMMDGEGMLSQEKIEAISKTVAACHDDGIRLKLAALLYHNDVELGRKLLKQLSATSEVAAAILIANQEDVPPAAARRVADACAARPHIFFPFALALSGKDGALNAVVEQMNRPPFLHKGERAALALWLAQAKLTPRQTKRVAASMRDAERESNWWQQELFGALLLDAPDARQGDKANAELFFTSIFDALPKGRAEAFNAVKLVRHSDVHASKLRDALTNSPAASKEMVAWVAESEEQQLESVQAVLRNGRFDISEWMLKRLSSPISARNVWAYRYLAYLACRGDNKQDALLAEKIGADRMRELAFFAKAKRVPGELLPGGLEKLLHVSREFNGLGGDSSGLESLLKAKE